MAQQSEYREPSGRPPMRLGSLMIRVALILLCLVMISIHLMGGMYAKYTTKGSGGDDARVAKFEVLTEGDAKDLVLTSASIDSASGDYKIRITNNSEVAVTYTVTASAPEFFTDGGEFEADKGNTEYDVTDKGGRRIIGTLAPGASITHTMTFFVKDWTLFTNDVTGEEYHSTNKYKAVIAIKAEQID